MGETMPEHVQASTLREWLEKRRPVTVLDVRSDEDRLQWSIPGSLHINAYEALKAGSRTALSDIELPTDRPVVTVCNLGRMSERAAAELSARGIHALSLEGGMKAWSLAWNVAALNIGGVRVMQVRRTGKGCLSYILSSGKESVVIDASLPPEVYMDLAAGEGTSIRYVLDTHIHADHLSRSQLLAAKTGAELLLPKQNRARFPYTPIVAGQSLAFSEAVLTVISTPGHTAESVSYFLNGSAVFTGDTLFPGGVGRPDLDANQEEARTRAALLFHSVQQLLALGPDVVLLPGHASEPTPFDGRVLSSPISAVAAKLNDWLTSEKAFVARILERIPPTPPNYARIVELNEAGTLPEGDPTDLEAGANRCAVS
jgi:glyoxylase-like metal-dependent hydrolase (beta-lactamase superfamily II)/rhodanese-related sulfurtransferase